MADQEQELQADQISNAPLPEQSTQLFGHKTQLEQLLHAYESHKLHHAFLIAGQKALARRPSLITWRSNYLQSPVMNRWIV